jgi:thiol-disulfide isomerase/thioredoxin
MVVPNRSQLITLGILIAILLILGLVTYARLSPGGFLADLKNDLKTIEPEAGASYTDLDGNEVSLLQFKGEPLIINAWATWIPFSQTELPMLSRAKEKYGDQIAILAINRMEERPVIRSFVSTFGVGDGLVLLVDPTDNFYKAIGGYAMPETIFYHRDGTIAFHKRGVLTEDELNLYIEEIIRKD